MLPLQLCDLAAMAAIWGLWSHSLTAFALTHFWDLTLTSQAFVSPELNGPDFPSLRFLWFFGTHCLVVWAAIYLTWGVGLRPNWSSYRVAVLGHHLLGNFGVRGQPFCWDKQRFSTPNRWQRRC